MKDTQKKKLLAVTGMSEIPFVAEGIESTITGHVLTEDAITRVAEALEANDQTAAALQTATARITELETQLQDAGTARQLAETNLATATEEIGTLQARVDELESEGGVTKTGKSADGSPTKAPFHLSENNPMNKIADSLMGKPKAAAEV